MYGSARRPTIHSRHSGRGPALLRFQHREQRLPPPKMHASALSSFHVYERLRVIVGEIYGVSPLCSWMRAPGDNRRLTSRVNSALPDRIRHAINRQHISSDSVVHTMLFGVTTDVVKRADHNIFKLLVHDGLLPEIALPVLHPLEI